MFLKNILSTLTDDNISSKADIFKVNINFYSRVQHTKRLEKQKKNQIVLYFVIYIFIFKTVREMVKKMIAIIIFI